MATACPWGALWAASDLSQVTALRTGLHETMAVAQDTTTVLERAEKGVGKARHAVASCVMASRQAAHVQQRVAAPLKKALGAGDGPCRVAEAAERLGKLGTAQERAMRVVERIDDVVSLRSLLHRVRGLFARGMLDEAVFELAPHVLATADAAKRAADAAGKVLTAADVKRVLAESLSCAGGDAATSVEFVALYDNVVARLVVCGMRCVERAEFDAVCFHCVLLVALGCGDKALDQFGACVRGMVQRVANQVRDDQLHATTSVSLVAAEEGIKTVISNVATVMWNAGTKAREIFAPSDLSDVVDAHAMYSASTGGVVIKVEETAASGGSSAAQKKTSSKVKVSARQVAYGSLVVATRARCLILSAAVDAVDSVGALLLTTSLAPFLQSDLLGPGGTYGQFTQLPLPFDMDDATDAGERRSLGPPELSAFLDVFCCMVARVRAWSTYLSDFGQQSVSQEDDDTSLVHMCALVVNKSMFVNAVPDMCTMYETVERRYLALRYVRGGIWSVVGCRCV